MKDPDEQQKSGAETVVMSVRIPQALRDGLSAKCKDEGITVVRFVRDCVEGFLDGRLEISPPEEPERPSYIKSPTNKFDQAPDPAANG